MAADSAKASPAIRTPIQSLTESVLRIRCPQVAGRLALALSPALSPLGNLPLGLRHSAASRPLCLRRVSPSLPWPKPTVSFDIGTLGDMKVFLSSVRHGLEAERDALPGLIKAIGHEPIRFEQFTAQPVPSREACMNGVDAADAYVLLLGEHFGHVFRRQVSRPHLTSTSAPVSGGSHAWCSKSGVDMDTEQQTFAEAIGEYGAGSF